MTKIVNLFGGPGIGKSSIASGLTHKLKKRHISCDNPYEFPKELAWDKNTEAVKDQLYVIANQHRGITRSWGEVDFIVVDSPLLLAPVYKTFYSDKPYYPSMFYGKEFDRFIISLHNQYDNINILLKRDEKTFENRGRYQTLQQSILLDNLIKDTLDSYSQKYYIVDINDKPIKSILKILNLK